MIPSVDPSSREPNPAQAAASRPFAPAPVSRAQRPRSGPWARPFRTLAGLAEMAVQRLRYYAGLSLLALLGAVIAVGLVTSAAFFAQAVDQVMMRRELAEYTRITQRPPFSSRVHASSSTSVPLTLARAETLGGHVADTLSNEVGLPVKSRGMLVNSGILKLNPAAGSVSAAGAAAGSAAYSGRTLADVNAAYMENLADHMTLVEGAPLDGGHSGDLLDVWMYAKLAAELGVQIGDRFELTVGTNEAVMPVQVAGVWQPADLADPFWTGDPDQTLNNKLMLRRDDYIGRIEPMFDVKVRAATWNVILDEEAAVPAAARRYVEGFERARTVIGRYLPDATLTTPTITLTTFVGQQTALTTLLLGFNVPALGFLLYFLVLTSAVIAYWQRRETAILMSRGITRWSVLNFTLIEGLLLVLISLPLGLLFGVLLARLMGYTVSFLQFDWRPALPVSLAGLNLPLTAATLGVVLLTKLWTTAAASRQSVVTHEREHSRPTRPPFWYRNYLDFLLIVPTVYVYRQLTLRGSLGALIQDRPADLYQDPLLILVPGFFILTAALLSMRLFPLLMRLLDLLARRMRWLSGYLALRQLGRQSHTYINPLLLVIVSLALGVYTLSMAASLDKWLVDQVFYRVGSDLTLSPFSEAKAMAEPGSAPGGEWIPPVDEFAALPGVAAAARVGDYQAEISVTPGQGDSVSGRFLAVDRLDLPDVAWFRPDFAGESMGALMNRLALVPDGVLVPRRFLEAHALQVGDRIRLLVIPEIAVSVKDQFTIVGAYEHFPTVYEDKVALIGNLEYINSQVGITMPHRIWMRLREGVGGAQVVEGVRGLGIDVVSIFDTRAILAEEQAKMERVGVFGTLTVSYLAATFMAALGLMTYSYASLNERLYVFSVLRAIGLRRGEVIGTVALEYAVLTVFGAAAGVAVGRLASELFIPLFRISSTGAGTPLPPLLPIIADDQILPLAASFIGVMILLEVVIISSAFYRRLFEALRLGHQG